MSEFELMMLLAGLFIGVDAAFIVMSMVRYFSQDDYYEDEWNEDNEDTESIWTNEDLFSQDLVDES